MGIYRRLVPNVYEFKHLDIVGQHFKWNRYGILFDKGMETNLENIRDEFNKTLEIEVFIDEDSSVNWS